LGAREFELAGDLKAGPGVEEGSWRVCNDYKIERRGRFLVPCGDRWETVRPLETPGLLVELARLGEQALELEDFEEPIIRFVRRRGLLGLGAWKWQGGEQETIEGYVAEILQATNIVRLYSAVLDEDEALAESLLDHFSCKAIGGQRLGEDDRYYRMPPLEHALTEVTSAVAGRVNELCYVTAVPPRRSHEVAGIRTGWGFDSLIGAAYLQTYWLLASEGGIRRCKHCRDFIFNPRKNQEFCRERYGIRNKCKNDWNYHHGGGRSHKDARKAKRGASRTCGT
jgi:hypothetical protein